MNDSTKNCDIDAKREARRKRIIENASNRLGKISGTESSKFSDNVIYPDPEIERDVYERSEPSFINSSHIGNNISSQQYEQLFTLFNNLQSMNNNNNNMTNNTGNNLTNFLASLTAAQSSFSGGSSPSTTRFPSSSSSMTYEQQQQQQQQPQLSDRTIKILKLLNTKIHLVLLAFISYIMILTDNRLTKNVFLIFLLWELSEMYLLKTHTMSKYITLVFTLIGIPVNIINILTQIIGVILKILIDLRIFLFFFILCHLSWMGWDCLYYLDDKLIPPDTLININKTYVVVDDEYDFDNLIL